MLRRALLLLGVAAATGAFATIREDELECEEAVLHLEDCCESLSFDHVRCEYETGCDDSLPDFNVGESECIQERDCTELIDSGICERAAVPKDTDPRTEPVNAAENEVCP